MSESFTKLFASITDSSVWSEDHATVRLWITLLAMADRTGYVGASLPGLAARARITLPETEAALAKFLAPDPYSRSKDHEGRRIELADRGWRLLNHARYREQRDSEARRAWDRERKRRQRAGGHSTPDQEIPPRSAHAEADTDSELGARRPCSEIGSLGPSSGPSGDSESVAPAQTPRRARRDARSPQLALGGEQAASGPPAAPSQKTRAVGPLRATGEHPAVLSAYARAYAEAHGHQPTIGAKEGARVATLLRSHSGAEILRRLDILASRRGPAWLYRDGGAWDLGTLVANFDKLAVAAVAERRESATGSVSFFLGQAKGGE